MSHPLPHLPDAPPFQSLTASTAILAQVLRRVRLDDAFASDTKKERLWRGLVRSLALS